MTTPPATLSGQQRQEKVELNALDDIVTKLGTHYADLATEWLQLRPRIRNRNRAPEVFLNSALGMSVFGQAAPKPCTCFSGILGMKRSIEAGIDRIDDGSPIGEVRVMVSVTRLATEGLKARLFEYRSIFNEILVENGLPKLAEFELN